MVSQSLLFVRSRRMNRFLLCVAVALFGTGCARAPKPEDVTKVVVSRSACALQCEFWQAQFEDGLVRYTPESPANDLQSTISGAKWKMVTQLAIDAIVTAPAHPPRQMQGDMATVWVEAGARHWQARFPTGRGAGEGDAARLQADVEMLDGIARNATSNVRERLRSSLAQMNDLTGVSLVTGASLSTCGGYRLDLKRPNQAVLTVFDRAHTHRAVAAVDFERITRLLISADAPDLQRAYPYRTEDVRYFHMHLHYRHFDYDVDAPDRTQWPNQVQALVSRFDQLVADIAWPPLHLTAGCSRSLAIASASERARV